MTKKRSTKRALALSFISLLLCVSMFVGTTFAWFTDSVSSLNNKIVAGNLDVELYYQVEGQSGWTKVDEDTNIFKEDTLWEPGHTEVVKLKVVNEGTLALKYNLGVNVYSETVGINVAGEVFKLSDYIKYGVVDGAQDYTRDTAIAAVDATATKLNVNYSGNGKLLADEEAFVTMVVYMPTTVGNEANYKTGTNPPVINLGINLFATQYTHEEDSFDKYYDGAAKWLGDVDTTWYDASKTELTIGSAEELAGLAQIVNTGVDSFAGKTIKLVSDLNLNKLNWTPIGNWDNTFDGTFDGNGHTIYNLLINDSKGEGVGLFGVVANATIKGVSLCNVEINAYSMVAGVVGAAYPANISDCHISGEVEIVAEWAYVGGIAGYCYYGTQVDGCSVIAKVGSKLESVTRNAVGGITAWLLEGDHKVTNCSVENLDMIGWSNVGGITGFVHYNNTIDNCSVKNVNLIKTRADGCPGIGLIAGGYSYSAANAITLTNNTVDNVSMSGTHIAYSSYNELYGSEYGGSTSANFVLVDNTVSGVSKNLVEVVAVNTVADLKAALANGGEIVLSADITVDKNETITIVNGVSAVINMNGKTISGTADKSGNQELFLVKGDLTVKNGFINYVASNNQGWNSMITIFDVTAGGALTMNEVNATVAGTDMNFIVHLNNWGTASAEITNCEFDLSYVAVRAFNSGYDMNTVTIKNTDVKGGGRLFWVHNYTAEGKDDSTLTLNIYNNGNTSANAKPVRFGFSDSVYYTLDGVVIKEVSTQTDLNNALTGDVSVNLSAGNFTMPGANNSDVAISGTKDTVITVAKPAFHGSDVTFNGVTIKGSGYATGVQHVNTVTYNNATIIGEMCLYGEKVVFNNCTFELNNQYIWTYGAAEVEFNNCTFNTNGKAILVYNEGAGASKVTVKGCTFNATAGAKAGAISNQNCAAIEIDNFQSSGTGVAHVVVTENNTYSSNFSGEWRIKNYVNGNAVTVNGTEYTKTALDGKLMTVTSTVATLD